MIKIKKGKTILKVSNSSYNEIFKNQGYEIVKDEINSKKNEKEEVNIPEENKNINEGNMDIVSSEKLTEKIDMGVNDNLFPSKEKKKGK